MLVRQPARCAKHVYQQSVPACPCARAQLYCRCLAVCCKCFAWTEPGVDGTRRGRSQAWTEPSVDGARRGRSQARTEPGADGARRGRSQARTEPGADGARCGRSPSCFSNCTAILSSIWLQTFSSFCYLQGSASQVPQSASCRPHRVRTSPNRPSSSCHSPGSRLVCPYFLSSVSVITRLRGIGPSPSRTTCGAASGFPLSMLICIGTSLPGLAGSGRGGSHHLLCLFPFPSWVRRLPSERSYDPSFVPMRTSFAPVACPNHTPSRQRHSNLFRCFSFFKSSLKCTTSPKHATRIWQTPTPTFKSRLPILADHKSRNTHC